LGRLWVAGVFLLVLSGFAVAAGPFRWERGESSANVSRQDRLETCDALRQAKAKVYGFSITKMSEAEIDAKGKEIEAFWKQVQAAGPEGANCLRGMLVAEKTDHNFRFDAASVLFQMDRTPETLKLVRDAVTQTDFQETDPANYISLALELGQDGVDIQPLAAKLLRNPNAVIHIPEHSLDLDADTAALFLYGSMPTSDASKALIGELRAAEPFVRAAAAHLLAEQLTEDSFRAIGRWDGVSKIQEEFRRNDIQAVMKYQAPEAAQLANPKFTREQVLKIVAGLPHTQKEFDDAMNTKGAEFEKQMKDKNATQEEIAKAVTEGEPIYGIADHTAFLNSAIATLKTEDLETLREARRKSLSNVSDESLSEYLSFTRLMIALINRLDLYKEYRTH
jgi:hypothetical protein